MKRLSVSIMPKVRVEEVRRFMEDSLKAVGAPESEAKAHAALLLHADVTGHFSHGLNRLVLYINDIKSGATCPNAKPVILKEAAASAWVDGKDALGATVGHFCMDIAIRKAKEAGIGIVAAKRSTHYGMAGYWAVQAEKKGLIGMSFTNSSPLMVPTRAKKAVLGTNPLSMAAPATGGDSLVVDMASTVVALGKVEVQIHKGEPLPEGWALRADGNVTTDAAEAYEAGRLLPLGGFENTSGYKGYALGALVEVLCSGLSGSKMTHEIRTWQLESQAGPPDNGQCFIAIDPEFFAPGCGDRVASCLNTWRSLEPVDPSLPVLAPGDKERINAEKTKAEGTIAYSQGQIDVCKEMAAKIGAKPIEVVN